MGKLILAIVVAIALVFGVSAQEKATLPRQETKKELVMNSCGNEFSMVHWQIENGAVTFDVYLASPGVIEKAEPDNTLMFKGYHTDKEDSNGNTPFHAQMVTDSGHKLELNGLYRKDKAIAVLLVNGELGHVFWGHVGKAEDLIKEDTDAGLTTCKAYHAIPKDDILDELAKQLK